MLAAPTEEEDHVAVAPKETVDKATEQTAEARLEERMAATRGNMGGVPVRWRPGTRIPGGERTEVKPRESRGLRRAEELGRPAFQRTKEKVVEGCWGGRRSVVERIKVSKGNGESPSQSGDSRIEVWRTCACWNDPEWKQ